MPLVRALACVLLIGIVYSATFGAVHSHKNVSFKFDQGISASTVGQAGISEMPLRSSPDGNECLVCVLHRDFSNSTVHSPTFILGSSTEISYISVPAVFYYSNITISRPLTRQSGRAPPLHLA
jgi:hypothetical protein